MSSRSGAARRQAKPQPMGNPGYATEREPLGKLKPGDTFDRGAGFSIAKVVGPGRQPETVEVRHAGSSVAHYWSADREVAKHLQPQPNLFEIDAELARGTRNGATHAMMQALYAERQRIMAAQRAAAERAPSTTKVRAPRRSPEEVARAKAEADRVKREAYHARVAGLRTQQQAVAREIHSILTPEVRRGLTTLRPSEARHYAALVKRQDALLARIDREMRRHEPWLFGGARAAQG